MRRFLTGFGLSAILVTGATAGTVGWPTEPPRSSGGAPLADDVAVVQGTPAQSDPTVMRSRYVAVDVDVFPDPRANRPLAREPVIPLQLFPDVYVVGEFDRFDPNPRGVTWVGRVQGMPTSTVTLVYGDGLLFASVVTPGGFYQIRPAPEDVRRANPTAGGEVHVVSQIDQAAFPREAPPIEVVLSAAELSAAADLPMPDTAATIDLMVVYTAAAANYAGGAQGITSLISLGVSETNTSYLNSGVLQRLRLVHSVQVAYTETSSFSTSLNNLRSGTGALSGVAALRDTHRADLVMMLVRPTAPDACGIAFVMNTVSTAFAPSGFNVVDAPCVSPNYTFAHELGHNMGAQHDWYVNGSVLPYSYAHGHVNPEVGQRWRTIMAYADHCTALGFSCTRLLAWANPESRRNPLCAGRGVICSPQFWYFPGQPMGIPGGTKSPCQPGSTTNTSCDADDRRALNNTALSVANFRQIVTTTSHR